MSQTESLTSNERVPTHRCKVCGCKWILWPPGSHGVADSWWSLGTNEKCGPCCDNVAMGDQIETLAEAFERIRNEADAERLLRKGLSTLLEAQDSQEATGLQCEKDGVCALVSRNDDEWHCTACNGDFVRKQPVEPSGSQPVKRWNTKYPGISMLEHNGDLVRSGFGPYVLAEHYDQLASLLAEAIRMIEGYRRAGWITNPAALEQATDFALRAGNSHHE